MPDFHDGLIETAIAACRAIGTGDCNLVGWIQRASRAVRMMVKQWGGKAPDAFDSLWNAVVIASSRNLDVKDVEREAAVHDCYSWLMEHFNFTDGDLKNERDNGRSSASGLPTEPTPSPGRESGEAAAELVTTVSEPGPGDTTTGESASDDPASLRAPD